VLGLGLYCINEKVGLGVLLSKKPKPEPGVDVMVTIFCDFSQFSAEKMAFFSKTNVIMKFLQKIAVVSAKNAIFC
jgi:hypothetical protein